MDFKSKTVIVTGASSGIGLALAREFAAAGANVVMGARSEDKLAAVAADRIFVRSKGVAIGQFVSADTRPAV